MSSTSSQRLHSLDLVRAGALLLGVVFHAALSFSPSEAPLWIVMDSQRSQPVAWLGFFVHIFRMTTFFLLAGYFGRMAFHRRGPAAFIKSRAKRIAGPLVIFWPIMMVVFTTLLVWSLTRQYGLTTDQMPPPPPMTLDTLPLTHLWFLYVLLGFYIVMLIARLPIAMIDRDGALRARIDTGLRWIISSRLSPLLFALPIAAVLFHHEGWNEWFGVPTPDYGIIPNTPSLVTYGIAFFLGWQLGRGTDALAPLKKNWLLFLVSGVSAAGVCLYLLGGLPSATPSLEGREKMIFAASYSLAIWYLSFAFIGGAMALITKENRVTRYLADSSYWLYIIHMPLVLAMQIWMFDWNWSAEAKYGFILGTTIPVMLLSYQILVRHTFVGNLLNGPRNK